MKKIIRGLRNLKGFTQEEVAKKLNVSKRTYWNKENNPDTFTVAELKIIAELFEVKTEIFFSDKVTLGVS